MNIRQERPGDLPQIYELVKRAFEMAQMTTGHEQDFVDQLRASDGYIPELALVAEDNGELIGHLMLTHTSMTTADGELPLLLLGPVAVVLERRKQGVGSRLVKESLRLARELGHKTVILVGDPAYYRRFGFGTAADLGIRNTQGIPDEYVMACELVPGALDGVEAAITFST
jgi:predicted N-acetyltransferase YhbS